MAIHVVGAITLQVLHTPGHAGAWFSFHKEKKLAFVGCDFGGSIGRTDFPRGDFDTLINSINNKLFSF